MLLFLETLECDSNLGPYLVARGSLHDRAGQATDVKDVGGLACRMRDQGLDLDLERLEWWYWAQVERLARWLPCLLVVSGGTLATGEWCTDWRQRIDAGG